ncbi:MAG TPA: trigger factor, partial [Egibacteraceae bacterium]|nr:trigger factor [Egibacteraceae bacterium]
KIPGFRPGKAPRRVLESHVGKGPLLQEAAREALPGFYAEAAESAELQVVGPPAFDVEIFEDGKDAEFTATVEVRPEFDLPDYASLQIPYPDWELADEDVQEQLDSLRERFAELDTVQRPAQVGDYVVVTLTGKQGEDKVDDASGEDLLYEVKDPKETESALDEALLGTEAGGIVTFSDTPGEDAGELAGVTLDFTALVKEVKAKRLPDLDDEFALTASEFDTIEELTEDLRKRLARQKRALAAAALRGRVVEAVTEQVDVPLPKALVDAEVRGRLQRLAYQAEQSGLSLQQYLQATGADAETITSQIEAEARKTVKAQLVIDAIGEEIGVEVNREDLGEEVSRHAAQTGRPPEELARFLTHPDRIGGLISDVFRRKAIDHLVEAVQVLSPPPPEPEIDEVEEVEEAAAVEPADDEVGELKPEDA